MFLNVKDFSANALFSVSARNAFWVKSAPNVVEQCMVSIKCILKVVHFTVCWQILVFFSPYIPWPSCLQTCLALLGLGVGFQTSDSQLGFDSPLSPVWADFYVLHVLQVSLPGIWFLSQTKAIHGRCVCGCAWWRTGIPSRVSPESPGINKSVLFDSV